MTATTVPVATALAAMYPAYLTRYHTLRSSFQPLSPHLRGKRVLDYGCGRGLSSIVCIEHGASSVVGVDLFQDRIAEGRQFLQETGYADRITLAHVEDTRDVPYPDGSFDVVLCNALFEHIPQPRDAWIKEVWRLVAPGGVLLVNETPNKYLPADFHTLHLPLTNWLPSRLAHWIGVQTGRFRADRDDWIYSGWRGMGYYELVGSLTQPYTVEHEQTHRRHRIFRAVGLPAALLDPYPCYVIRKG